MAKCMQFDANRRALITDAIDTAFDWVVGDLVGLVWLNNGGWREYQPSGFSEKLFTADNFLDIAYKSYSYRETRLNAYARYLALNGYKTARILLQGYSQGDWAEALVYCDDEDELPDWVNKTRQWWKGDVYDLQAQTRKVFTAEDGETLDKWETLEDGYLSGYLIEYGEITKEWLDYVSAEMGWK